MIKNNMLKEKSGLEGVESSGDFNSNVEMGIGEAMDLLKKRYEGQPEEENNLPFHNSEHTLGVIRRTEKILKAIQAADQNLVNSHDLEIGRLASAFHDTVQEWEKNTINDGNFEKVLRKRFAGNNETASSNEAVAFMVRANENEFVFSDNDKKTVQRAINATVPGWDMENKTIKQPNLQDNNSLVERAVALADLATAGMDGPEKFVKEGKALFREENLDILEAVRSGEDIPKDKQESFKKRILGYLKSQANFAKGRQARLEEEIQPIRHEEAREAVAKLFSRFEDSIQKSKEVADEAEGMTFEELVEYMGY